MIMQAVPLEKPTHTHTYMQNAGGKRAFPLLGQGLEENRSSSEMKGPSDLVPFSR